MKRLLLLLLLLCHSNVTGQGSYGFPSPSVLFFYYSTNAQTSRFNSVTFADRFGYVACGVAGYPSGSNSSDIFVAAPVFPNGTLTWSAVYNGEGNGADAAYGCAPDSSGNVYVCGQTATANGADIIVLKYKAATGELLGRLIYNHVGTGAGASDEAATAICTGDSGSMYVTGWSRGSGGAFRGLLILRLDAATMQAKWVSAYAGTAGKADAPFACTWNSGAMYAGAYYWNGSAYAVLALKYSRAGALQWARQSARTLDQVNTLVGGCAAVPYANTVYVGATVGSANGYRSVNLLRYSPEGTLLLDTLYNRAASSTRLSGLVVRPAHLLVVMGTAVGGSGQPRFVLQGLDSVMNKPFSWNNDWYGTVYDSLMGLGMVSLGWGGFATVGALNYGDSLRERAFIQYWGVLYSDANEANARSGAVVAQCYPNPAPASLWLQYTLATAANVSIVVYSVTGEKVVELAEGYREPGEHRLLLPLGGVPAGMYVARLLFNGKPPGTVVKIVILR